ncbi:MAG: DUF695 domain-containing protein [Verrucomicrobiaceae bacterium]|nr:DUF695 domain-containing protein [Verrucomicrobiaceae bacterium]
MLDEGMSVVPEQNWESYLYRTDNGPVISTFYTEADKIEQSRFPHCARIIIPIQKPNENGGPANEEADVLWAMEDDLAALLTENEADCLMVGRLTHSGKRELVFQVGDWDQFRPYVGLWLREIDAYEGMDISEHEGWDFFFDSVWPSPESWQWITDKRVVASLMESGSDPEKLHVIEYCFRGSEQPLRTLAQVLSGRGYQMMELSSSEERLLMSKTMPLDMQLIGPESVYLMHQAESLGLEFDGWGALSVK